MDCFTLGPSIANVVRLAAGDTTAIWLNWDDTFSAVTTDYDLFAFENATVTEVAASFDDNPVTGEPVEVVALH